MESDQDKISTGFNASFSRPNSGFERIFPVIKIFITGIDRI
jgi:hypothetical protein